MKLLLLLIALFVLFLLVRSTWRRARKPPPVSKPAHGEAPQQMLRCAQCGLHLPRDEALAGRGGVFCGDAHREAFERAHPKS